jgi:hypothetical protein
MKISNVLKIRILFSILIVFMIGAPEVNAQYTITNSALNVGNPGGLKISNDASTAGFSMLFRTRLYFTRWSESFDLPFNVTVGNNEFSEICISPNGLITFSTEVANANLAPTIISNSSLPYPDLPDNTICYFWDDNAPYQSIQSSIWEGTFGTEPHRQHWILNSRNYIQNSSFFAWYAVVFEESTNNIYVVDMNYFLGGNTTATVGLQINSTTAFQANTGLNSAAGSPHIIMGTGTFDHTDNEYYKIEPVPYQSLDVDLQSIDNFTYPFIPGPDDIEVSFKNNGTDPLTSVDFKYTVNSGPVISYPWTGTLASGNSINNLNIGTYNFTNAHNEIKVWVENPNAGTDQNNANDTIYYTACAPLSGAYTIGAAGNYPNLNAAVSDLHSCGIIGPVTFNILPGSYEEKIIINEITGSSPANTITFQSSTGDSSDVTIHSPASGNDVNNYTVLLSGVDYLILKDITISRTGTDEINGNVIVLENASNNITIRQCRIIGNTANNGGNSNTLIYKHRDEENCNDLTISEVSFLNGSYGINIAGMNSTNLITGFILEKSTFHDQKSAWIRCQYLDAPLVQSNSFSGVSMNNNHAYFGNLRNGTIIKDNKFHASLSVSNNIVFLSSISGETGNHSLVANNMISCEAPDGSETIGLKVNNTHDDCDIVYNSVSISGNGTNSNSKSFEISGASSVFIRNNIFANLVGGYAQYNLTTAAASNSNYNDLFTTGPNLAYYLGSHSSLASFKTATGTNANTINVDPVFQSSSDLHTFNTELNAKGLNITQVADDIDGDVRTNPPDIGADEFAPLNNNASVLSIEPLNQSGGVQDIKITFKNSGTAAITTAQFEYSVNGTPSGSPYSWGPGNLASGNTDGPFTIGSYNFQSGYNLVKAWPISLNGGTDGNPVDDTATYAFYVCNPLSGNYTIGGAPGPNNYSDFSSVANDLSNCGISGPVVFNIVSATYTEQFSIGEIGGTSATNTVTFQSAAMDSSQVILQFPATDLSALNNYLIQINGADHVFFKHLTFKRNGLDEEYAMLVEIKNNADNISFEQCHFIGIADPQFYDSQSLIYSRSASGCDNFSIEYCMLDKGSYGLNFSGINNSGGTGVLIGNNILSNQSRSALNIVGFNELDIYKNLIDSEDGGTLVYLRSCNNGVLFHENNLKKIGIGNVLQIGNCTGTNTKQNRIYNNFLSFYSTSSFGSATGLNISNRPYTYIYNNSIHMDGDVILANSRAYYQTNTYNDILYLRNNSIVNNIGGYAVYFAHTGITSTDYNNLYTNGTVLARWQGDRTDLAALKAASGMDVHSISVDPVFVSTYDLHLSLPYLDGKALPVGYITEDIDGDLRNATTPDIGADEYDPVTLNARVLSIEDLNSNPGIQDIKINFLNAGTATLTEVEFAYTINGGAPIFGNTWNGTLGSGLSAGPFTIDAYNFSPGDYVIKAYPTLVNTQPDNDNIGDTATYNIQICALLAGDYDIGTGGDFTTIQAAVDQLEYCGISAAVTFNVLPGTYTEQVTIHDIPGSSATNTITFQSSTLNASDVLWTYPAAAAAADNFTLQLNGAEYLVFNQLTIERAGTTQRYGTVVNLSNASNNNLFTNCIIQSYDFSSSGFATERCLIYSDNSSNCDNNSFTSNQFTYGAYAIYMLGVSEFSLESGNSIENNVFENQYYRSINLYHQNSPTLISNTITNTNSIENPELVYLYDCNNGLILSHNNISKTDDGFSSGIYLGNCSNSVGNEGLIANNFVSTVRGVSGDGYGILIFNSDHLKIYNNNINIAGPSNHSTSAAFNYLSGSNNELINNSLTNQIGGYSAYFTQTTINTDHNNYFSNGTNLAYWNGDQTDLTSFQAATLADANSISIDPWYHANNDLHTNSVFMNGEGISLAEVPDDIDGEIRGANPDIGADEYDPYLLNVWVSSMDDLQPAGCLQDIAIDFINAGTTTLTEVEFGYSVDGTQLGTFNWVGNLLSKQSISNLTLGSVSMVTGEHTVKAYPISLNTLMDEFPNDDTVTTVIDIIATLPDNSYTLSEETICTGETATITMSGSQNGVTYQLRANTNDAPIGAPIAGTGNPITFDVSPAVTTTYNVLATNDVTACASELSDLATVTVNPLPDAIITYGTLNTPPSFTEQVAISTSAIEAWSVYSTDIDGDGHMDVLYASNRDDKIAWFKNTDGAGTFGAEQTISTNVIVPFSVYAMDLDGDGDMDVLSASISDNKIAWYENTDGDGTFGAQQVISTAALRATSVYSTDLDGDGDMDVLSSSSSDNKIAWYENDGTGNFGSQIVISTAALGASSVYATDMDGDGDMDVLSASWTDNKIAWYENTDGAGTFGAQNVISTVAMNAVSVYATDMDGDGDMDVVSASNRDDKIAWYENTDGDGTFWAQQVISTAALRARSVYATDLDGDGDMDVLSASYADNKIAWYENTDGDGTFGAQQVISTAALGAISVYATDIDGDGDMDVLSASFTDDKIAWYKSDLFDAQCAGDIQFNEEGGDATAWTWTSTNGAVSFDPNNTDQNPLVSNIADGDTVRVVITDGNGCTSRASVHMYINPLPDSSLDVSDPAVCLGQDATITVSASVVGVTYQLQLDSDDSPVGAPKAGTGGAIDFVLLAPTTTGDYNVLSYFDATGCEVELVEKSTVFVNDLPGLSHPVDWI